MNFVSVSASSLPFASAQQHSSAARCARASRLCRATLFSAAVVFALAQQSAAQIYVTTIFSGVTAGLCSLQEAIYATAFKRAVALDQTEPDDTYDTGCSDSSNSWNIIVLPGGTLTFHDFWDGDAHNSFGPTATPIISSTVTILGNGTILEWAPTNADHPYARMFAVGYASITPTSGVLTGISFSGTGNLTLQDVWIKNFTVKGGNGACGGGGGMGAGGAIYVGKTQDPVDHTSSNTSPVLTVVNSTFSNNSATGGNGSSEGGCPTFPDNFPSVAGGGGGLYGNGGAQLKSAAPFVGGGGGGGGARGNGGNATSGGGGGGGSVENGGDDVNSQGGAGGNFCGGEGGDVSSNGHNGCSGGGGGGGGTGDANTDPQCIICFTHLGGNGGYGGGGGGSGSSEADSENGGNGGFGGGGGGGGATGGNGGFGGGAGNGGTGGLFGGSGGPGGGGGAALGGAIFNDSGNLTIQNSTFYNNAVTHGLKGDVPPTQDGLV